MCYTPVTYQLYFLIILSLPFFHLSLSPLQKLWYKNHRVKARPIYIPLFQTLHSSIHSPTSFPSRFNFHGRHHHHHLHRAVRQSRQVQPKRVERERRVPHVPILSPVDVRGPIESVHGGAVVVGVRPPRRRRPRRVSLPPCLPRLRRPPLPPLRRRRPNLPHRRRRALLPLPRRLRQKVRSSTVSILR